MYYASKSHGERIYHEQFCTYVRRMKVENRIHFYTMEEAVGKGYRECNCCSFIGKKYHKELKEISLFAKDNHIKVWFVDGEVYIETRIGAWKITSPGKSKKIFLNHANAENFLFCKKENGKIIHTYHAQSDISSKTIMGYLRYIDKHDRWRESVMYEYRKMPTSTKKQKKKYKNAKRKANRRAAWNVLNMIETIRVEREYFANGCN